MLKIRLQATVDRFHTFPIYLTVTHRLLPSCYVMSFDPLNLFLWPSVRIQPFLSLFLPASILLPLFKSPALPYVTEAHIRENNLWQTWIRDAARFPMIYFWYENIRKYLDRRGLSDQCCQSVVGKHVSVKPACWEDPWITMRGGGGRSGAMRKWRKRWDEMIMDTKKKKAVKYPLFFFAATIFRSACYTLHYSEKRHANRRRVKNSQEPCPHRWTSSSELPRHFAVKWCDNSPRFWGMVTSRLHQWSHICESIINAQRYIKG